MNFINSYKRLEQLCNDMFNDKHGISIYIDKMINTSNGCYYVDSWDEDLKQLKHYRWIRNKIVHEPDYTEEDLCEHNDEVWLNNFYNRILNQKDPLALYRKQTHKTQNKNKRVSIQTNQTYTQYKEPSKVSSILVTLVIIGFIIMMILSILYFFIS